MNALVVLVALYATVLVAGAFGLARVGRINSSPWASRVTLGHRRATGMAPDPAHGTRDWPHSAAPVMYDVIALVAAVAALVLSLGALVVAHSVGALILVPVAVVAFGAVLRLGSAVASRARDS